MVNGTCSITAKMLRLIGHRQERVLFSLRSKLFHNNTNLVDDQDKLSSSCVSTALYAQRKRCWQGIGPQSQGQDQGPQFCPLNNQGLKPGQYHCPAVKNNINAWMYSKWSYRVVTVGEGRCQQKRAELFGNILDRPTTTGVLVRHCIRTLNTQMIALWYHISSYHIIIAAQIAV